MAERQGILHSHRSVRWFWTQDRVVVHGSAGGIRYIGGAHLVGGDPCLDKLAERDLLGRLDKRIRGLPVPAVDLVRLQAHAGIALPSMI